MSAGDTGGGRSYFAEYDPSTMADYQQYMLSGDINLVYGGLAAMHTLDAMTCLSLAVVVPAGVWVTFGPGAGFLTGVAMSPMFGASYVFWSVAEEDWHAFLSH
jgi:hypothetical protein